jgi:hypothetical protein
VQNEVITPQQRAMREFERRQTIPHPPEPAVQQLTYQEVRQRLGDTPNYNTTILAHVVSGTVKAVFHQIFMESRYLAVYHKIRCPNRYLRACIECVETTGFQIPTDWFFCVMYALLLSTN